MRLKSSIFHSQFSEVGSPDTLLLLIKLVFKRATFIGTRQRQRASGEMKTSASWALKQKLFWKSSLCAVRGICPLSNTIPGALKGIYLYPGRCPGLNYYRPSA